MQSCVGDSATYLEWGQKLWNEKNVHLSSLESAGDYGENLGVEEKSVGTKQQNITV